MPVESGEDQGLTFGGIAQRGGTWLGEGHKSKEDVKKNSDGGATLNDPMEADGKGNRFTAENLKQSTSSNGKGVEMEVDEVVSGATGEELAESNSEDVSSKNNGESGKDLGEESENTHGSGSGIVGSVENTSEDHVRGKEFDRNGVENVDSKENEEESTRKDDLSGKDREKCIEKDKLQEKENIESTREENVSLDDGSKTILNESLSRDGTNSNLDENLSKEDRTNTIQVENPSTKGAVSYKYLLEHLIEEEEAEEARRKQEETRADNMIVEDFYRSQLEEREKRMMMITEKEMMILEDDKAAEPKQSDGGDRETSDGNVSILASDEKEMMVLEDDKAAEPKQSDGRDRETSDGNVSIPASDEKGINEDSEEKGVSVTLDKNDKAQDSDSDDDRPQIFVRNLAEIQGSDEEDATQVIDSAISNALHLSQEDKIIVKRRIAALKLAERSTTDESLCGLLLSFEEEPVPSPKQRKRTRRNRSEIVGCQKLASWLARAKTKPAGTFQSQMDSNVGSRNKAPAVISANSRDSSTTVMNNMLQSVQHTFPGSNQTFPRGPPVNNIRQRQPVPPLNVMCGPGPTYSANSNLVGRQVTTVWQQGNRQPVPLRNSAPIATSTTANRPQVTGNNMQQPFAQLIFDPASGLLLCPTNQTMLPQTTAPGQMPQRMPTQPTQLRFQNGMIIRPNDPTYNVVRHVIGNRKGLEISVNTTHPMQQQRMVQPARPTTTPIRPFVPNAPPPSRTSTAAPARIQYQPAQQQQIRPRAPIPGPRGTPIRYPPVRPNATQMQHPTRPNQVPQVQRPSQPTIPVVHQILTPGSTPVTPEPSNVTAGNQKPIPGTVDDSNSDLQNKTFPSLVVQVKTGISAKADKPTHTKARSDLDASVKGVLVLTPAKFTEWLMRRGLLKLSHNCDTHPNIVCKLGMYSESGRQPFSGGYVWTTDCCPEKQISVFHGSIFEGSKYPPGTVLKLIYHWACQTPANNILQWVKVSSFYLKNFYTLIRAVCIAWMHEYCPPMGGEGKYVQLGVITLGSSAETSRGLKNVAVEILGVYDPATKVIRLKVINSMQGQVFKDKGKTGKDTLEQGARAFQILWALTHWVDKRSILVVDGMIDKSLFHEIGFRHIHKCDEGNPPSTSNATVMNYLRNLVPKMFSSTLSVLSKSIVQQFLDELSWREMHGSTVLNGYNNLLEHISTLTKWDFQDETLIARLNKINQNPFVDWSNTKQTRRCPLNTIPLNLRNEPGIRECVKYVMKEDKRQPPPPPVYNPNPVVVSRVGPAASSYSSQNQNQKTAQKRKNSDIKDVVANIGYYKEVYETEPKVLSLQIYYYGTVRAEDFAQPQPPAFPANLKCPLCIRTFSSNVEIVRHMFIHIGSATYRGSEGSICRICLKELSAGVSMTQHIQVAHVMTAYAAACRICEEKFKTEQELVIHMWDQHQRRETPYKCRKCGYASSFHCHLIQHYQDKHAMDSDTVCPFCLKTFSCANVNHLKQIIGHLQSHSQQQRRAKKCPRCVLSFVSDVDLELHLPDHHSQEPSARWIPYIVLPNETNLKMATPPATKNPLSHTMMAVSAASVTNFAPAAKKPKLNNDKPVKKKEKATLNATLAVPIDTNEKFGGSKYNVVISSDLLDVGCSECGESIKKPNHFIGKLFCSKCRYGTWCQAAMDLHHANNHSAGSKQRKPGLTLKKPDTLKESMLCKCGFSSAAPFKLASHLITCDKRTVYPQRTEPPPSIPVSSASNATDGCEKLPPTCSDNFEEMVQENLQGSFGVGALSPTLGLLSTPPTSFDDMLQLEESMGMGTPLDALNLPSMYPSTSISESPLGIFQSPPNVSSSSANPTTSQSAALNNSANTETSSTWDTDWELPMSSLIAKC